MLFFAGRTDLFIWFLLINPDYTHLDYTHLALVGHSDLIALISTIGNTQRIGNGSQVALTFCSTLRIWGHTNHYKSRLGSSCTYKD